jgi:hypothetical protein
MVGIKLSETAMENNVEVPQNNKNRTTIRSSNTSPRYISRRMYCRM